MRLYRYDNVGWDVILNEYEVVKETPCGYWFEKYRQENWIVMFQDRRRWTSKTAMRRLAYPTKEEAMVSFKARKRSQIKILRGQLE